MEKHFVSKSAPEHTELTHLLEKGTKVGSGGFVKLVDWKGSDESIVKTARVSTGRGFVSWDPYRRCSECALYGRTSFVSGSLYDSKVCMFHIWVGSRPDDSKIESFPNGDNGIIHNLVRERHTSPVEFGIIDFHLRVPMDIWRQLVRHRTASVSEYSTRYSVAIDEMATTSPHDWRLQATQNRQGSSGLLPRDREEDPDYAFKKSERGDSDLTGSLLSQREAALHSYCRAVYQERLSAGVAKEQARKDLPLSNYTEVFFSLDCHNLMHLLGLRLEEHAQKEARDFGKGIVAIFKLLFPRLHEAFEEYKLYAVTFSRSEMATLQNLLSGHDGGAHVFHKFDEVDHPFYGEKNKAARVRFLKKFGVT